MALPARRADLTPAARARMLLRSTGELVVPGVVAAGAMWVLVPAQYAAAKAFLVSVGVPVGTTGLLAPVALGALIWGVRWAVRAFRPIGDRQHAPTRDTTDDPPS